MTSIRAFSAIRPSRDKVHLVATRPYYTYKRNVLKAKLEDNPFTFLHIINPEFRNKKKTEPNSRERFELVKESYQKFIDSGILQCDNERHLYLYRQTKDNHEYTGVVAGASINEYKNGLIKKHEGTIKARAKMFTEYLDVVGYNAEPVLLTYQDDDTEIESILELKAQERPEYEYTTTDLIKHELWLFSGIEVMMLQHEFKKIEALYIADGHHRCASSERLQRLRTGGHQGLNNEDYFLGFFMNENRIKIFEYNRLIRTLNGLSVKEFISRLEPNFTIKKIKKATKPKSTYELTMCVEGDWYSLTCKPSIIDTQHPVKRLVPEILTNYVLGPILGIEDLTADENIEFVSGNLHISKMRKLIRKGEFKIGFVLYPLEIGDVRKVADNNMIMPPKSTWMEPKLRSGLTIYNIDE